MADSPVWFRFFIEDFERDTRDLTPTQVGIYIRLLLWHYRTTKPIPSDLALGRIALAIGLDCMPNALPEPLTDLQEVLGRFFEATPKGFSQKRCEAELRYWRHAVDSQRSNAKQGWDKRKKINGSHAAALERHSSGNENQNQNQNQKNKRTTPLASSPNGLSAGDVVTTLPCNTGEEIPVGKAFLGELEKAYPDVDPDSTIREIRAWCIANPQKRKTKGGLSRFINSWFARVQNG